MSFVLLFPVTNGINLNVGTRGFAGFATNRIMSVITGALTFVASTFFLLPFLRQLPFMKRLGRGAPFVAGGSLILAGVIGAFVFSRMFKVPILPALFMGLAFAGGVQIVTGVISQTGLVESKPANA